MDEDKSTHIRVSKTTRDLIMSMTSRKKGRPAADDVIKWLWSSYCRMKKQYDDMSKLHAKLDSTGRLLPPFDDSIRKTPVVAEKQPPVEISPSEYEDIKMRLLMGK